MRHAHPKTRPWLLEKARHHRQKIIHPQANMSAYNRHVSMVRDAHWQCKHNPSFHRFSSWFYPRQLLAAVEIALLLAYFWVMWRQESSRRVRQGALWFFALNTQILFEKKLLFNYKQRILNTFTAITFTADTFTAITSTADTFTATTTAGTGFINIVYKTKLNIFTLGFTTTPTAGLVGLDMFITAVACSCT